MSGVQRLLRPVLLPSYTALANRLQELGDRMWVEELWAEVFDDAPPQGQWYYDLQCAFVGRVHQQMFPVNLQAMDELFNSGEERVLSGPVMFDGRRVPWECEYIGNLERWAQPVVAVAADLLVAKVSTDEAWNGIDAWWDGREYERPRYAFVTLGDFADRLRPALAAQAPPLDGLATALDCVQGETGNVWLDRPVLDYVEEYDIDAIWEYCWCASCLRKLAAMYQAVRDDLRRLDAYAAWYKQTEDAEGVVIALLTRLVDQPWTIRDGEVIWDE